MNYFEEKDTATIQQYLSNQLTGADRTAFEERLKQDPHLLEELELYKALFVAVEDTEDQRLKELLRKSDTSSNANRNIRRISIRKWSIAAGFLLLIAMSTYFIFDFNQQEDYFEAYPLQIENPNRSSAVSESFTLYESGKYEEALTYFTQLPDSVTYIAFYKANCLLFLNKNKEAIPLLHSVEADTNSTFARPAKWYLAIAYYKMGNKTLAEQYVLETIKNKGVPDKTRKKAQKLLKELNPTVPIIN